MLGADPLIGVWATISLCRDGQLVLCQATFDLDSSKRMRLLRWSVLRLWR
jgi:hypothetical protein